MKSISKREFLGVTAKTTAAVMVAGVITPTVGEILGFGRVAQAATKKVSPFTFAVLTDAHLYEAPKHKFDAFLAKGVSDVNQLNPDFVLYAGDLGQTGKESELTKGKKILDQLKMPYKIIPGEHDYYLDMGKTWRGLFGDEHWSFDHKGVHVIGLNSILVKDFWTAKELTPAERMDWMTMLECSRCGLWGVHEEQLAWLEKDVKGLHPSTPVIIMTHSPLWDYYPRWNFQTFDAPEIRSILRKFEKVMAIHGHVHQVLYNEMGNIASVGLMSTSWPWPYPPVQLPHPEVRMNRVDPGDFEDGLGSHTLSVNETFQGAFKYRPFSDGLLPDNLKQGFKI
jgi:Icc protein